MSSSLLFLRDFCGLDTGLRSRLPKSPTLPRRRYNSVGLGALRIPLLLQPREKPVTVRLEVCTRRSLPFPFIPVFIDLQESCL
jgi:hypothetical protein